MKSLEMGKEAALQGLAEFMDAGNGITDCCSMISHTINQPMQKHASEEDQDFRRGVESICYDFLKTANEYYGTYEVTDEQQALEDILVKVANETVDNLRKKRRKAKAAKNNDSIQPKTKRTKVKPDSNSGVNTGGSFNAQDAQRLHAERVADAAASNWTKKKEQPSTNQNGETQAEMKARLKKKRQKKKQQKKKQQSSSNSGGSSSGKPSNDSKSPGRMQKLVENIKDKGADAAQWAKDNPGKATGAGVGAAALGAGGLYALKKRRDKKKKEEQEKAAHLVNHGLI